MSHIFDALQRSQAEPAGTEPSLTESPTLSHPTELLQIVERKWRGEVAATGHAISLEQFPSLPISILPNSRLVSAGQQESLGAEKFRFLAVRLRQLRQSRPLKRILITSTIPQEGKSTVAANLACTLARRKPHKTLLLEGDLRRPTVSQKFGLGKVPGLSEWLRGETETMNVYRLEALGLWVLPAGSAPENPLELMQSGKLSLLMNRLTSCFDWIVIDSPPVLPLADTSIWARLADGVLLVTRKSVTEKRQLKRGLQTLEPARLLGALVNGSTDAAHSDYYQRYGPAALCPESSRLEEVSDRVSKAVGAFCLSLSPQIHQAVANLLGSALRKANKAEGES
jgi:capsular exopolysaccharide synthesis family protein